MNKYEKIADFLFCNNLLSFVVVYTTEKLIKN